LLFRIGIYWLGSMPWRVLSAKRRPTCSPTSPRSSSCPSLYLAQGYGSLYEYCTRALHLSEDAACNRTKAVRACQEFPVILDMLFAGQLTLTAVRLLGPHLTADNHQAVLARAAGKSRGEVERLVAEIAPRPDVATSVRKLPAPRTEPSTTERPPASPSLFSEVLSLASPAVPQAEDRLVPGEHSLAAPALPLVATVPRPIIQPLSPERYRVQFTMGQEAHDRLRRVQSLMRREIPNGDVAAIFDRALELLEQAAMSRVGFSKAASRAHARKKVTAPPPPAAASSGPSPTREPTPDATARPYENRIRFETDGPSRHIPNAVKRAVWQRDHGQCAFIGSTGQRCAEQDFLEFHHIHPHALGGAATIANISLRCRRHNAFEAEADFGSRGPSTVSEAREVYRGGAG
jgi:5-methylcytosine-specific restriction endonuclease McrA